ncbi:MAG TPA: prenyltransferase/squalene oxidase repeat-containing protein [Gemmataceae bacterium]|jgi:prenyltransferase beta subunit|nr:prenyltransferase/squalene oxidase repeat-containing protein [Gemmataceae bacterium]
MTDTFTRRHFLATGAALCGAGWARGQDPVATPDGSASKDMLTPEAIKAIDRGLAYLASAQHRDGGFGDRPQYEGNVAIVALCGLAFMAGGNQPGRGQYGRNVTRALEFVLSKEQNNPHGFLYNPYGSSHPGPMYSHGFATMFLAEAHGMVNDKDMRRRLRDTLARAVQVICKAQNQEGGWRYQPIPQQADISVTICQVMALRSARNAGLEVPRSVVDKCVDYIKGCQATDGGFRYFKQGGTSLFPRSAAAVCGLYSAGIYQGPAVTRGLEYLRSFKPSGNRGYFARGGDEMHYYYGHYYAAQAMWTAGGEYWKQWFPAIREDLLARARSGSWTDNQVGADYGTAMACIILQIPNNYLPILQK